MRKNNIFFRTVGALVAGFLLLSNPAFANDLDDIDKPAYQPADVVYKDVVVCATPTDIPSEFAPFVVRTYPEGKMKAFLMSFDDGGQSGYTMSDRHLILPYLRENGLVAAFSINQQASLASASFNTGYEDPNASPRVAIYSGRSADSQQYKDVFRQLYEGMEVVNHTRDHYQLNTASKDTIRTQLGQGKFLLETTFGREVGGAVAAGGNNAAEENKASKEWRIEYYKYIGHRYNRNGPTKWPATAGNPASLSYAVPTDFYDWNPTIKLTQDNLLKDNSGNTYSRVDILNYFLNADMGDELKLLCMWGHAWEMGANDKSLPNVHHAGFVEMCELAGQNLDILWNPTSIDYTDYINAMWNVQFSAGQDGAIVIYNPSGAETVWHKVYGELVAVGPGNIVTVDKNGNVISTEQGETVVNNRPGGLRSGHRLPQKIDVMASANSGTATVSGMLSSAYAGKQVSLLVVGNNADDKQLAPSDIVYLAQAEVDAFGEYSFAFPLDDIQFDENGMVSNYRVLVNYGSNDVTTSLTKAVVRAHPIFAQVDVTLDDTLATVVANVDNMGKTKGQTYTLVLVFYGENKQLIGIKISDTKALQDGLVGYRMSDVIPAGTVSVKALIWDTLERAIPWADGMEQQVSAP